MCWTGWCRITPKDRTTSYAANGGDLSFIHHSYLKLSLPNDNVMNTPGLWHQGSGEGPFIKAIVMELWGI